MKVLLFPFLLLAAVLTVNAQSGETEALRQESVYFDFGKHGLRPEGLRLLQQMSADIEPGPAVEVNISGHTDSIGSLEDNLALSRRRCAAAAEVFRAAGWPDSLITLQPKGETQPAADNSSDQGRQENRRVDIALYAPSMRQLSGQVKNQASGEGVSARLWLEAPNWQDSLQTDSLGRFQAMVPLSQTVRVEIQAKGFFFDTQTIEADEPAAAPLSLPLAPTKVGAVANLKNFYFVGDQDILLQQSLPELPRLLRFMEINPNTRIEIAGHINQPNRPKVDTSSWDFKLSVRRAKRIHDYLIQEGVSPERLEFRGYGNWQMAYPNAVSAEQQALNRRVEIKILEE